MITKNLLFYVSFLMVLMSCSTQIEPLADLLNDKDLSVRAKVINNSPNSLFRWDFDGNDSLHNLGKEDESTLKDGIRVVSDPFDSNNKVLMTLLLPGHDRTEVCLNASDVSRYLYYYANASMGYKDSLNQVADSYSLGNEIWVRMRILKPQEQNTNGIKPCIVQFGPVSNMTLIPSVSSSGYCQLQVRNGSTPTGDSWNWRLFGGNVYVPTALNINTDINFVSKPTVKWDEFVLHCKMSSGSDGVIEVYKDGFRHIHTIGANTIANNRFRLKWGVYIGMGNSVIDTLHCYFDDIKVVNGSSSYNEMKYVNTTDVPAEDTYIYGNNLNGNYGNSSLLHVKDDGSTTTNKYKRVSFLRFDISDVNFNPYTAKLLLTTDQTTAGGTLTVKDCIAPDNWVESALTWNANPITVGSTICSQTIAAGTSRTYILNLTDYIINQYNSGKKIFTIALTGNNNLMVFRSKEYILNNIGFPKLQITN